MSVWSCDGGLSGSLWAALECPWWVSVSVFVGEWGIAGTGTAAGATVGPCPGSQPTTNWSRLSGAPRASIVVSLTYGCELTPRDQAVFTAGSARHCAALSRGDGPLLGASWPCAHTALLIRGSRRRINSGPRANNKEDAARLWRFQDD